RCSSSSLPGSSSAGTMGATCAANRRPREARARPLPVPQGRRAAATSAHPRARTYERGRAQSGTKKPAGKAVRLRRTGCCAACPATLMIGAPMSKALIIAEKPSVASDIARALGGFTRHGDYYESDEYVLSSAVGHLVEIAVPEQYEVKRGKWSFAHL